MSGNRSASVRSALLAQFCQAWIYIRMALSNPPVSLKNLRLSVNHDSARLLTPQPNGAVRLNCLWFRHKTMIRERERLQVNERQKFLCARPIVSSIPYVFLSLLPRLLSENHPYPFRSSRSIFIREKPIISPPPLIALQTQRDTRINTRGDR